ncbi:hypothetical protein [Mycobacterium sp. URHB0044]|uniref:hypothetical protein n=1 Tax=Mycobacterium sp. URHB0044 TaxID=1380386 RepID=UPI0007E8D0EF|nr:hypothetical protein [Mycobacterium sp. URHB0044]
MAKASPSGDVIQLSADHVGDTVAQLERRIDARFGERGLTKAARDLGDLVALARSEAGESRDRLRRTTLTARTISIAIIAATLFLLALSLRPAVTDGLAEPTGWVPLAESVVNDVVFVVIAVLFLWAFPERLERRSLLRLLHRLRSLAHVIDMHQLSKDPEQVSPGYTPTAQSVRHGLDADQMRYYLGYCSEMLSLTAKTAALCAEHSTDGVVLETISTIETLTTELSNKIWQKISLLP